MKLFQWGLTFGRTDFLFIFPLVLAVGVCIATLTWTAMKRGVGVTGWDWSLRKRWSLISLLPLQGYTEVKLLWSCMVLHSKLTTQFRDHVKLLLCAGFWVPFSALSLATWGIWGKSFDQALPWFLCFLKPGYKPYLHQATVRMEWVDTCQVHKTVPDTAQSVVIINVLTVVKDW